MTGVLVKLGIFLGVTLACTLLVANTLYRPFGESTTSYKAQFSDTVGLKNGSDVRIAGVRVGKVTGVDLENGLAVATFEVVDSQRVPADVEAHIRYADLLGARYIALKDGKSSQALAEDAMIPLDRTRPAVDLTDLFNGFKPVFQTLKPAEVNQLARELVAVFQGQGGTVNSLLRHVVALTGDVAEQDQLIGEVLTGLNEVTDFALKNEPDFKALIESLSTLTSNMAKSRSKIANAIDASSELATSVSDVFVDLRPALQRDLTSLNELAGVLVDNKENFAKTLKATPPLFKHVNRASEYGAWINVYLCTLTFETGAGIDIPTGTGSLHSGVCRA